MDTFTKVDNELLQHIASLEVSPRQYRILLTVVRYTCGFHLPSSELRAAFIANYIGYKSDVSNVRKDLKALKSMGVIRSYGSEIGLNMNYEEWKTSRNLPVKGEVDIYPPTSRNLLVEQVGIYSKNKLISTPNKESKENNKKENLLNKTKGEDMAKNIADIELPDCINREQWKEWCQFRKEIKKPVTPTGAKRQIKLLSQYSPDEQTAMFDQSITAGWTGLFAPKPQYPTKSQGVNQNGKTEIDRMFNDPSYADSFYEQPEQPEWEHGDTFNNGEFDEEPEG